ncbi:uncharacterized protein B0H64DRAFT_171394 [Chaetomium fimeti]|uniref:Uncharacterized protein n=1 Tax=Chaetomium fimeti TaxID=1854472 RepID=A0AAE0LTA2_9PEZI|nr:hypothetical protein B0H64DRAFT_171394 [Chaetomium fimeti]
MLVLVWVLIVGHSSLIDNSSPFLTWSYATTHRISWHIQVVESAPYPSLPKAWCLVSNACPSANLVGYLQSGSEDFLLIRQRISVRNGGTIQWTKVHRHSSFSDAVDDTPGDEHRTSEWRGAQHPVQFAVPVHAITGLVDDIAVFDSKGVHMPTDLLFVPVIDEIDPHVFVLAHLDHAAAVPTTALFDDGSEAVHEPHICRRYLATI